MSEVSADFAPYWLTVNNPKMVAEYGPFISKKKAWQYYFGRDYSPEELSAILAAGWKVVKK